MSNENILSQTRRKVLNSLNDIDRSMAKYTDEDLTNAYRQALLDVDEFIDQRVKTTISEYCKVASPEVYEISAFIHRKLGKKREDVGFDKPVLLEKIVSKCHSTAVYTEMGEENTNFYRCSRCGEPCDVVNNQWGMKYAKC